MGEQTSSILIVFIAVLCLVAVQSTRSHFLYARDNAEKILPDFGTRWFDKPQPANHYRGPPIGKPFVPDKQSPYKVYDAAVNIHSDTSTKETPLNLVTPSSNNIKANIRSSAISDPRLEQTINGDTYYGLDSPENRNDFKETALHYEQPLSDTNIRAAKGLPIPTPNTNPITEHVEEQTSVVDHPLQHTAMITHNFHEGDNVIEHHIESSAVVHETNELEHRERHHNVKLGNKRNPEKISRNFQIVKHRRNQKDNIDSDLSVRHNTFTKDRHHHSLLGKGENQIRKMELSYGFDRAGIKHDDEIVEKIIDKIEVEDEKQTQPILNEEDSALTSAKHSNDSPGVPIADAIDSENEALNVGVHFHDAFPVAPEAKNHKGDQIEETKHHFLVEPKDLNPIGEILHSEREGLKQPSVLKGMSNHRFHHITIDTDTGEIVNEASLNHHGHKHQKQVEEETVIPQKNSHDHSTKKFHSTLDFDSIEGKIKESGNIDLSERRTHHLKHGVKHHIDHEDNLNQQPIHFLQHSNSGVHRHGNDNHDNIDESLQVIQNHHNEENTESRNEESLHIPTDYNSYSPILQKGIIMDDNGKKHYEQGTEETSLDSETAHEEDDTEVHSAQEHNDKGTLVDPTNIDLSEVSHYEKENSDRAMPEEISEMSEHTKHNDNADEKEGHSFHPSIAAQHYHSDIDAAVTHNGHRHQLVQSVHHKGTPGFRDVPDILNDHIHTDESEANNELNSDDSDNDHRSNLKMKNAKKHKQRLYPDEPSIVKQHELVEPSFMLHEDPHGDGLGSGIVEGLDIGNNGSGGTAGTNTVRREKFNNATDNTIKTTDKKTAESEEETKKIASKGNTIKGHIKNLSSNILGNIGTSQDEVNVEIDPSELQNMIRNSLRGLTKAKTNNMELPENEKAYDGIDHLANVQKTLSTKDNEWKNPALNADDQNSQSKAIFNTSVSDHTVSTKNEKSASLKPSISENTDEMHKKELKQQEIETANANKNNAGKENDIKAASTDNQHYLLLQSKELKAIEERKKELDQSLAKATEHSPDVVDSSALKEDELFKEKNLSSVSFNLLRKANATDLALIKMDEDVQNQINKASKTLARDSERLENKDQNTEDIKNRKLNQQNPKNLQFPKSQNSDKDISLNYEKSKLDEKTSNAEQSPKLQNNEEPISPKSEKLEPGEQKPKSGQLSKPKNTDKDDSSSYEKLVKPIVKHKLLSKIQEHLSDFEVDELNAIQEQIKELRSRKITEKSKDKHNTADVQNSHLDLDVKSTKYDIPDEAISLPLVNPGHPDDSNGIPLYHLNSNPKPLSLKTENALTKNYISKNKHKDRAVKLTGKETEFDLEPFVVASKTLALLEKKHSYEDITGSTRTLSKNLIPTLGEIAKSTKSPRYKPDVSPFKRQKNDEMADNGQIANDFLPTQKYYFNGLNNQKPTKRHHDIKKRTPSHYFHPLKRSIATNPSKTHSKNYEKLDEYNARDSFIKELVENIDKPKNRKRVLSFKRNVEKSEYRRSIG